MLKDLLGKVSIMAKGKDNSDARTSALAGDLRDVVGKLHRRLRGQSHLHDLNLSQTSVLTRLLKDGPATVTTLAKAEGVRSQSMGATIATLEAASLVSGAPDPKDGRQTILSLTDLCRERIEASRVAKEDWLFRSIQANLQPTEQEALANALGLLRRLADLHE
jgi:DNA-binding MarR family transcriptional regulator